MQETTTSACANTAQIGYPQPTVANGLAAVGSAFGLIYGIKEKKRWWMVLLYMAGGAMAGRGAGYVYEATTTKN